MARYDFQAGGQMNIDGDYSIRFESIGGDGGGVLTLREGALFGGDSAMYYTGSYEVLEGNLLKARAAIRCHSPCAGSIFGPMFDTQHGEFSVVVEGTVAEDRVTGGGYVEAAPEQKMRVVMQRIPRQGRP